MNPLRAGFGVEDVMALRSQVLARNAALRDVRAASEAGGALAAPGRAPGAGFGAVTDIAQVMLARQEAGVAFEATLQVRNKLLSAYQDIMRMGG